MSMHTDEEAYRPSTSLRSILPQRSVGLKLLLVCGLALLMAIPALFVYGVLSERSNGQTQALAEVAEKVGGRQSVLGPVIAIPYSYAPDPNEADQIVYGVGLAYAKTGEAITDVLVEERRRGIHLVPIYKAKADFTARFDPASFERAIPRGAKPIWADARLYIGLSDSRGLKSAITVAVNEQPIQLEPTRYRSTEPGQYNPVPDSSLSLAAGEITNLQTLTGSIFIKASLELSGADRLAFAPFAEDTSLKMSSNWPSPSFTGGSLPDRHNVGDSTEGFTAEWSIPYLARGIPGAGPNLHLFELIAHNQNDLAVRFIREANPYQSVQRALKYAAMFVGFVFLAYFLFEVTSGLRAHPAQYVLVGLAQTIFYLLLLALSEKIGFDAAFFFAATMTITLTSAYAMSVFRSRAYGLRAFGILSAIYGVIFMLLRAEGSAMLTGAFASFAAIAITMYMTRNVDWYGDKSSATA